MCIRDRTSAITNKFITKKIDKNSKLDVADINAIVMVTIDNQKEEEAPTDATKKY